MQGVAWGAAEAALRLEGEVPQRVVTAHEHVSRERRFSTLSDCGDKNTVFFIAGLDMRSGNYLYNPPKPVFLGF